MPEPKFPLQFHVESLHQKMTRTDVEMPEEAEQSNLEKYSEAFRLLVQQKSLLALLKGSHVDGTFAEWEKGRRFIADLIDQKGTLLDYGCANGFLLKCLEEWTGGKIISYGVDSDPLMIERAQELFPDRLDHFANTAKPPPADFPKSFTMIYWNVWDNFDLASERGTETLKRLLGYVKPGGRLILGFYRKEKSENIAQVEILRQLGYAASAIAKAPQDGAQVAVAIDV